VRTTDIDLVIDREQLRSTTLDDPKLMREILLALVEDAGRLSGLMEAAITGGDFQRANRLARSSAQACGHVGAARAAGALRSFERAAAAADFPASAAALASLRVELSQLRSQASQL